MGKFLNNQEGSLKNMKNIKNLFIIAVLMIAGVLIFGGSSAKAQDQQQPETYDYTASRGDNLTYVVRDSINQYCKDNGENLNAAQRIYIETNVVNDMGAYWLDVNEQVHVSKPKLKEYVDSSKNLNESQQAAWQKYADTTSIQSIIDGSQTNVAVNKQAQEEAAKGGQNQNSENSDEQAQNSEDQASDNKDSNENKNEDQKSWLSQNWAKLVLAALIASLVYRIVSDNQKKKS